MWLVGQLNMTCSCHLTKVTMWQCNGNRRKPLLLFGKAIKLIIKPITEQGNNSHLVLIRFTNCWRILLNFGWIVIWHDKLLIYFLSVSFCSAELLNLSLYCKVLFSVISYISRVSYCVLVYWIILLILGKKEDNMTSFTFWWCQQLFRHTH